MSDWFGYAFIALAIILVLLPPKYDPAIRLKEWSEKRDKTDD